MNGDAERQAEVLKNLLQERREAEIAKRRQELRRAESYVKDVLAFILALAVLTGIVLGIVFFTIHFPSLAVWFYVAAGVLTIFSPLLLARYQLWKALRDGN